MNQYTEDSYEKTLIQLFELELGYEYRYGPDMDRDYRDPLLLDVLRDSLRMCNPGLPAAAIDEAVVKIRNLEVGSLETRNEQFTDYLQNGLRVSYYRNGEMKNDLVHLIDYNDVQNNSFLIVNQFTVEEFKKKRPDIVLFVNGMPLVVIELKSPSRDETGASEGYVQLRNYMLDIPCLFNYNQICVMSDMLISRAGTISSDEDRYMDWKTTDGNYENTKFANFETFFTGIFQKDRFLNILKNFILFMTPGGRLIKILAGYHQYFAVEKAVHSTMLASKTDGRGGVFWHTQGSGKSLSMVFYTHLLDQQMDDPTFVVLTDRRDLDDQLFKTFSDCHKFLRQTPVQATSRDNLYELLNNRQSGGIIFTTMAKFEDEWGALSKRKNIIVMADEAHRSQYGLTEKFVTTKDQYGNILAKTVIGAAKKVRDSLPNATYIGFTGTPIDSEDKDTRAVFGDYIDIYDMTQAVEDGATRPVYYESRVMKLKLDEETLRRIDNTYDMLAAEADEITIDKSKKELSNMEAILGSDETIDSLARDIITHYKENRENLLTGKALIVAYSREIAVKLYHKMLELEPTWDKKVKIVMTGSNKDPEEWHEYTGTDKYRADLAKEFKDNESDFKIAIVRDMWLTGFDVPSLATMYVFKPMSGHNLMQAIARVNRVFGDKEGGLVVDYIGIASALKQAMKDYTKSDQKNFGDPDIKKKALPIFEEALFGCRDLFKGYDYKSFLQGTDLEKGRAITGGVNYIMDLTHQEMNIPEKERAQFKFIKEAQRLKQSLSLCSSLVDDEQQREAGYFIAVKTLLNRISTSGASGRLSLKEVNAQINELLKQTIKSDGVISLFSDHEKEFSLFDTDFLEEIRNMKEKNLSLELLKRLLNDEIRGFKRTNVVKSEEFSDRLKKALNSYVNGLITNEEVIEELMRMAKDIRNASQAGNDLGLSVEEVAFYDALCKPEAVKDFYENDQLVQIAKELTDILRHSVSIDWQRKESARAGIRKNIRRLLRKYHYPPEEIPGAIELVLSQAELMANNLSQDL